MRSRATSAGGGRTWTCDERLAIELKYLTSAVRAEVPGEAFHLRTQAAQDLGRYDILKDLVRVERLVAAGLADRGIVAASRMIPRTGAAQGGVRGAGDVIEEAQSGLGQPVEGGSANLVVAVTAQYPGGQSIGQDEQDMGPLAGGFGGGEGGQGEAAEEEMAAGEGHGELQV